MKQFIHLWALLPAAILFLGDGLQARPPQMIDPDQTAEQGPPAPQGLARGHSPAMIDPDQTAEQGPPAPQGLARGHSPAMIDPDQTAEQGPPRPAAAKEAAAAHPDAALESIVVIQVNQCRQNHELPPLALNELLNQLAREHSRLMAEHKIGLGHAGFHERFDQAKQAILNLNSLAENVALNGSGIETEAVMIAVNGWMKSPAHRRNILGKYNQTGVGVWIDARGTVYFTQIFALVVDPKPEE